MALEQHAYTLKAGDEEEAVEAHGLRVGGPQNVPQTAVHKCGCLWPLVLKQLVVLSKDEARHEAGAAAERGAFAEAGAQPRGPVGHFGWNMVFLN